MGQACGLTGAGSVLACVHMRGIARSGRCSWWIASVSAGALRFLIRSAVGCSRRFAPGACQMHGFSGDSGLACERVFQTMKAGTTLEQARHYLRCMDKA